MKFGRVAYKITRVFKPKGTLNLTKSRSYRQNENGDCLDITQTDGNLENLQRQYTENWENLQDGIRPTGMDSVSRK